MISTNRLGFFCLLAVLTTAFWSVADRIIAASVIYDEDFLGSVNDNLNGSTVDVDHSGASTTTTWKAYSGFKQNGLLPSAGVNLGAWLPFAPQAGNTYTLSASLTGVGPDGTSAAWYAIGFGKSVPTTLETGDNRFISNASLGRAWMLFRPNNPGTSSNMIQLGNASTGTATGPQSPAAWNAPTLVEGGDIDMQIVLDTNPTTWTATFFAKRPTDSLYTQVSNGPLNLLAQDIAMVGIARTSGTLQGMITNFTLESTAPLLIPGDVNGDLAVNDLDFNIIRDHLFASGTRNQGDLTNDGFVDFSDFRAWKTAHEAGSGAGLSASVPEPASAVFALIAMAISLLAGRRRVTISRHT
jgi:hypothetical protein